MKWNYSIFRWFASLIHMCILIIRSNSITTLIAYIIQIIGALFGLSAFSGKMLWGDMFITFTYFAILGLSYVILLWLIKLNYGTVLITTSFWLYINTHTIHASNIATFFDMVTIRAILCFTTITFSNFMLINTFIIFTYFAILIMLFFTLFRLITIKTTIIDMFIIKLLRIQPIFTWWTLFFMSIFMFICLFLSTELFNAILTFFLLVCMLIFVFLSTELFRT